MAGGMEKKKKTKRKETKKNCYLFNVCSILRTWVCALQSDYTSLEQEVDPISLINLETRTLTAAFLIPDDLVSLHPTQKLLEAHC